MPLLFSSMRIRAIPLLFLSSQSRCCSPLRYSFAILIFSPLFLCSSNYSCLVIAFPLPFLSSQCISIAFLSVLRHSFAIPFLALLCHCCAVPIHAFPLRSIAIQNCSKPLRRRPLRYCSVPLLHCSDPCFSFAIHYHSVHRGAVPLPCRSDLLVAFPLLVRSSQNCSKPLLIRSHRFFASRCLCRSLPFYPPLRYSFAPQFCPVLFLS